MKSSKSTGIFRPFKDLKTLLEDRSIPVNASPWRRRHRNLNHASVHDQQTGPESLLKNDTELFLEAMSDVTPILIKNRIHPNTQTSIPSISEEQDPDAETLLQLNDLIRYGKGFKVEYTSEYIEGSGYTANREVSRRLHRGDFSIQAHLDLHGLNAAQAKEAFDQFLKDSITSGKRAVLIVHGRGLSSPAEPVLKTKVVKWITYGPWRKWIIAYSSARLCDGGAGATYLLLRHRPVTGALKKKNRRLNKNQKMG
ncbi:Smr/MutS family protein [Thermodesulfobacteriota bacterium]